MTWKLLSDEARRLVDKARRDAALARAPEARGQALSVLTVPCHGGEEFRVGGIGVEEPWRWVIAPV